MHCKTCGNLLNDKDTVCGVCGAAVIQQEFPEDESSGLSAAGTEAGASAWPWSASAPEKGTVSENDAEASVVAGAGDVGSDGAEYAPLSGKFDFNWDSEAFQPRERRRSEPIDFKWNRDDFSPAAAISAAAHEKAVEEAVTRRVDEGSGIFKEDTFHLRDDPDESAHFMFSKKNEEFQELLDAEFEKIQSRQTEIDEARNRLNDDVMNAEIATPEVLVTGENALKTAEERIADFLEKADREMLEAINRRVREQIAEIDRGNETEKPFTEADIVSDADTSAGARDSGTKRIPVVLPGRGIGAETPDSAAVAGAGSYLAGMTLFEDNIASPIGTAETGGALQDDQTADILPIGGEVADSEEGIAEAGAGEAGGEDLSGAEAGAGEPGGEDLSGAGGAAAVDFFGAEPLPAYVPRNDRTVKVPDFVNRPVVFPFDEEIGYAAESAPGAPPETSAPEDLSPFPSESAADIAPDEATEDATEENAPEDATEENAPGVPPETSAPEDVFLFPSGSAADVAPDDAIGNTSGDTSVGTSDLPQSDGIAAASVAFDAAAAEVFADPDSAPVAAVVLDAATDFSPASSDAVSPGRTDRKKKRKALRIVLMIVVDLFVILAVLALCTFAVVKFAPDSGMGEWINRGVSKIEEKFGFPKSGDSDADGLDADAEPEGTGNVAPIADKVVLVSSQLYNNANIKEVFYDANAAYVYGEDYPLPGAAQSDEIENNYWTVDELGRILYDESAVAAIIRYNSALIDYINNGKSDVLEEIEEGSEAETKLAADAASTDHLEITMLGIGDIRRNGQDFFVWTIETVTETKGGIARTNVYRKLYQLIPDISVMRIRDCVTLD
ncbi:MAG: hypothetical protein LBO81_05940 [Clostridiales Family XIII bacterium]|jgi:hypothetical protein|nr:hypothetical protein [Clostridiales Family XIII bacterium]